MLNNCIILTNNNDNKYYNNPYNDKSNYYTHIRSSLFIRGSRSAHDIFKEVINNRLHILYIITDNLLLIEVVDIIPVLTEVLLATIVDELETLLFLNVSIIYYGTSIVN